VGFLFYHKRAKWDTTKQESRNSALLAKLSAETLGVSFQFNMLGRPNAVAINQDHDLQSILRQRWFQLDEVRAGLHPEALKEGLEIYEEYTYRGANVSCWLCVLSKGACLPASPRRGDVEQHPAPTNPKWPAATTTAASRSPTSLLMPMLLLQNFKSRLHDHGWQPPAGGA
jgi:hypothetical protein